MPFRKDSGVDWNALAEEGVLKMVTGKSKKIPKYEQVKSAKQSTMSHDKLKRLVLNYYESEPIETDVNRAVGFIRNLDRTVERKRVIQVIEELYREGHLYMRKKGALTYVTLKRR